MPKTIRPVFIPDADYKTALDMRYEEWVSRVHKARATRYEPIDILEDSVKTADYALRRLLVDGEHSIDVEDSK